MSFWKKLFGGGSKPPMPANITQPKPAPPAPPVAPAPVPKPIQPQPSTAPKPTDKHPGDIVPVTGTYYCNFCGTAQSAMMGSLGDYASQKGLNSSEIAAAFAAAGFGTGVQKKRFTAGERFSGCPECKDAASWNLE